VLGSKNFLVLVNILGILVFDIMPGRAGRAGNFLIISNCIAIILSKGASLICGFNFEIRGAILTSPNVSNLFGKFCGSGWTSAYGTISTFLRKCGGMSFGDGTIWQASRP
jgi:hypothetical protein